MNIAESFEVQGLDCFHSSDDPAVFFYVPAGPGPETDAQNRPTLLMLLSPAGAILQLGTHWKAEAGQLEALRTELTTRYPELDPSSIRLSTGASSVRNVTLELGDGQRSFEVLQSSPSSGFPPYAAIFNVRLSAEQKDRAIAALNGRPGFLRVTYSITAPAVASIEASISGEVTDDLAALDSGASFADCRERIESALADKRLVLRLVERGPVPEDMRAEASRLAVVKAANALLEMVGNPPVPQELRLNVTASLSQAVMTSEDRSTDISTWFRAGAGPDHVKPMPGSGGGVMPVSPPVGTDDVVRLGFDDRTDLPIAFVEVARAGKKAVLRPPAFEPVKLEHADSSDPATVTTNYTSGGPAYKATLSGPSDVGWVVGLEPLGLQQVALDASARRDAGAREVRVHVRYRPSGQGSEDDRTIYLRRDNWTATFYEVTRSATLNGVLEYDWKETGADGSIKNGRRETADTTLRLT